MRRRSSRPSALLGLADTPRRERPGVLKELAERGIGVRLITGDHPVTAAVVAGELGLDVTAEQVITGSEWEALSADERAEAVASRLVFARMTPEHKIDVVQTLERLGLVTAMVGDGANDAAAIRAASVGIGVAARGSDPARTAADVRAARRTDRGAARRPRRGPAAVAPGAVGGVDAARRQHRRGAASR